MALAFDAAAQGSSTTNPLTFSHTTSTNANRILFVGVRWYQGDNLTSVTYAGVAMTQINKRQDNVGNDAYTYLYYLTSPATGANNVVVTGTGNPNIRVEAVSASYTGDKGFVIDSSNMQSSTSSTMTMSTTVVKSNCWLVGISSNFRATSPGAGTTERQEIAGDPFAIDDSNGTVSTGSQSLQWTQTDSTISAQHIASFVDAAVAVNPQDNLLLLGVS